MMDIDLDNLPVGTKVKIVDKWRNPKGSQNANGYMDEFLGKTSNITEKCIKSTYLLCIDNNMWIWSSEMFQAIKLPDSDIWYEVVYSDINEKYVSILAGAIDIKPEEVIPAKQPESKYMVYVSGKASPKKVHNTYESACQEAQRLAGKEVGYVVSVCKVEKQFIGKVIIEGVE